MTDFMIVNPSEVKIKEDMPRFRKEMGKINDLTRSIERFGQMQPCVVNREMILIAGGRRLLACIDLGIDVRVVFKDTVDPLEMREMELEENIQRKAFTAAEEIMAVDELHNLKRAIHGEAVQGAAGGWSIENTAEIIGRTRSSVTGDLALADALRDFPVLANCKTKSDIKRAVKGLQRISDSVTALTTFEAAMDGREEKFEMHNVDCVEYMPTMKDKSVNILFTDPPYGISIHDVAIGLGGHTNSKVTTSGFTYDDEFVGSMELIGKVAVESARIVKDDGFAIVFCAISNFWIIRSMFEAAGWNCSTRPIIWIKNESGQNNAPSKWMSAGYESALFARKLDARMVVEGKVDWIQCPNVTPSMRIHQAEKPVTLIKEILSRVAMAGAVVFDPFAGSGATVEACLELNMYPIACEKLIEAYATSKQRVLNYINGRNKI